MSLFEKLSKIDDRTKYVVSGWIRKCEKELSLPDIPSIITSTAILYSWRGEYWKIVDPESVKVSDDKMSITEISKIKSWSNCFGMNEIASNGKGKY